MSMLAKQGGTRNTGFMPNTHSWEKETGISYWKSYSGFAIEIQSPTHSLKHSQMKSHSEYQLRVDYTCTYYFSISGCEKRYELLPTQTTFNYISSPSVTEERRQLQKSVHRKDRHQALYRRGQFSNGQNLLDPHFSLPGRHNDTQTAPAKRIKKNISRRKVRGKNDDFSVRWERIQPGFGKSAATFRAHRIFTFLSSASVHSVAYFTTQCWKVQYITQCNMYSALHNATHRIFTFFSNASVHSVAYFTTQC